MTDSSTSQTQGTGDGFSSSTLAPAAGSGSATTAAGNPRVFPKRARQIQQEAGIASPFWQQQQQPSATPLGSVVAAQSGAIGTPIRNGSPADDYDSSSSRISSTHTTPEDRKQVSIAAAAAAAPGHHSPAAAQIGPLPPLSNSVARSRGRAGTLPSSFGSSPITAGATQMAPIGSAFYNSGSATPSRTEALRGGPQHPQLMDEMSPSARMRSSTLSHPMTTTNDGYASAFGPSIFSSTWSTRGATGQPLAFSPAQSQYSRGDDDQTPVRTLDYLGLAETPTPPRPMGGIPADYVGMTNVVGGMQPVYRRDPNRIRSYSVNNTEKYDDAAEYAGDRTDDYDEAANFIQMHNVSPSRPRSRTAGVLESPPSLRSKQYQHMQSHLGTSVTAADLEYEAATAAAGSGASQLPQGHHSFPGQHQEYYGQPAGPSDEVAFHLNHQQQSLQQQQQSFGSYGQSQQPTRALWLGNVPASTPSSTLVAMFSSFGPIESARVLTHKSCAFVNFDTLESAVIARSACRGKELFPGSGPARIGFAKVPSTLQATADAFASTQDPAEVAGGESAAAAAEQVEVPSLEMSRDELISLARQLGADGEELEEITSLVSRAVTSGSTYQPLGDLPEPSSSVRTFDAPRLRDIRKKIDNNVFGQAELEAIAQEMLDEVAELSSDYLGNTVVQKLFEACSVDIKCSLLERIAAHLPEIGAHKNGTWAAQKIIDCASSDREKELIVQSLARSAPALFLDQFGNYVLQCCLRFGLPHDNFLFEAMVACPWEIAQGRYGARAIRACLESHKTTRSQQRLLAAVIILHAPKLATSPNGALLLTWLLDTCTLPNRYVALAPHLASAIVPLCTHKLASLTVLKVVSQRAEEAARGIILDAVFPPDDTEDSVIHQILEEPAQGPTLLFKLITTPYLDPTLHTRTHDAIRRALLVQQRTSPVRYSAHVGIKRLMDEVGVSARNFTSDGSTRAGPVGNLGNGTSVRGGGGGRFNYRGVNPQAMTMDPVQMMSDLSLADGMHQQQQYQALLQQQQQQQQQHQRPIPPQMIYDGSGQAWIDPGVYYPGNMSHGGQQAGRAPGGPTGYGRRRY
ncbi:hypothetical protein PYCC9005_001507 [Savitreella phatthalungensis]